MDENTKQKPCPVCQKTVDYYELECDNPFTAPAPLAYKALFIWGAYSAYKELVHQEGSFVHFRLGDSDRLVKMIRFDENAFNKRIDAVINTSETCDEEGCLNDGDPCFSLFEPETPLGYYCHDHKHKNGICPGCNMLLAGFESFDFSGNDYCADCNSQIDADIRCGYDDEDDDWDEDFEDERDLHAW